MTLNLDCNNKAEALIIHLELTSIAENIINNYIDIDIKDVTLENKKDNWKRISFNYKIK